MTGLRVAPELHSERLTLRRPAARDLDGYVAFMRSERARYAGGVRTSDEAWREFCIDLAHWELRGYGSYAVTLTGDDTCLGLVGPCYPAGWPEPEIAWLLWAEAEGRGIAHEAALAARDEARRALGWTRPVSYIHEDNARSIALAERLGAVHDRAAPTNGNAVRAYRHPDPEAASDG
jgi:RimJ/RimL family protein N-acetyltransferase